MKKIMHFQPLLILQRISYEAQPLARRERRWGSGQLLLAGGKLFQFCA